MFGMGGMAAYNAVFGNGFGGGSGFGGGIASPMGMLPTAALADHQHVCFSALSLT
jgi:hypothetical protein